MSLKELLGNVANDVLFTGVHVYRKNLTYIRCIVGSLDNSEVNHAIMLRWLDGSWSHYVIPTVITAHCVIDEPDRKVLALGADGVVHIASSTGFSWEFIDRSDEGPNSLRVMVDIHSIGSVVYAVGMARQVYKRERPGVWIRCDQGARGERKDWEIAGFKSVDGFRPDSLYAVGFKGEMWHFNGKTWKQLDSLTNLKLERVRCVPPDRVFVCGARGIFIHGNGEHWAVVSHDITNSTFWGLEHYNNEIYVADSSSLYMFNGEDLVKVETGLEKAPTTSYLHASDGVLWSVGARDIVVYDGFKWKEIS